MRKLNARPQVLFIVGIILALIAAGATYYFGSVLQRKSGATGHVLVVVSPQPVNRYTQITKENMTQLFAERELPISDIPADAFHTFADLQVDKGAVVIATLYPGDIVQHARVNIGVGQLNGLATDTRLENGYVAASISMTDIGLVASAVQPNDYVDVLASYQVKSTDPNASGKETSQLVTWMLFQHVLVLNTGSNFVPNPDGSGKTDPPPNKFGTVTLMLKPDDAAILKFLHDNGATIDFILHRHGDTGAEAVPMVDSSYVLNRYHLLNQQGQTPTAESTPGQPQLPLQNATPTTVSSKR